MALTRSTSSQRTAPGTSASQRKIGSLSRLAPSRRPQNEAGFGHDAWKLSLSDSAGWILVVSSTALGLVLQTPPQFGPHVSRLFRLCGVLSSVAYAVLAADSFVQSCCAPRLSTWKRLLAGTPAIYVNENWRKSRAVRIMSEF